MRRPLLPIVVAALAWAAVAASAGEPLPVTMLVPGFTVRKLPVGLTNLNNVEFLRLRAAAPERLRLPLQRPRRGPRPATWLRTTSSRRWGCCQSTLPSRRAATSSSAAIRSRPTGARAQRHRTACSRSRSRHQTPRSQWPPGRRARQARSSPSTGRWTPRRSAMPPGSRGSRRAVPWALPTGSRRRDATPRLRDRNAPG